MPPKKNLQQQLEEQNSAFQEMLVTFQQSMRDTMRTTIETAVRAVVQARDQAPGLPHHEERRVEEDDEDDNNNPFAGVDEPHHHRELIKALGRDNRRWESDFKLDIPEFSGSLLPDEFLDWINTTEEILAFKRVLDDMRVHLVATRFRGRASAWWQQTKTQRVREGKERMMSWDELISQMRKAFLPYNYTRTIYTRLQNLRQGSRTVDDYATDFFSLLARNDLLESEDQLVSRFIGGLRPQLQNTLLQFNPKSVSEAHQRALLVEQYVRGATSNCSSSTTSSRGTTDSSRPLETLANSGEHSRGPETNEGALVPRNPRLITII